MMKILIVGSTWDNENGKASGLIKKLADGIQTNYYLKNIYNGGNYNDLLKILNRTPEYDVVFWFANVSNDLPKIRDVKSIAPHVMLITSKRNNNQKYSFQELVQRTLAAKANLTFEFSKQESGKFNIRVFDPLGCEWYYGNDIPAACAAAMNRLVYLKSITRQSTIQLDDSKELVLKWYFDSFQQEMLQSKKNIEIPPETKFIELVHTYAQRFHEIMRPAANVKRFLGNCSMRPFPPQVGRCSKGMSSFKHDNYIFVSQRNVNKEYLDINHFIPVYMENGNIYYCGENKPSVDTPIQLRLYQTLPNIKYMLHSHCYIEGAAFTTKTIPCGAIEEVDEILNFIDSHYGKRNENFYAINLIGHGSILMTATVEQMDGVNYVGRPMPEKMY